MIVFITKTSTCNILRLTLFFSYLWELVDVFTSVDTVWDAETKIKVKALQESVTEIMSLYHPEPLDFLVTH